MVLTHFQPGQVYRWLPVSSLLSQEIEPYDFKSALVAREGSKVTIMYAWRGAIIHVYITMITDITKGFCSAHLFSITIYFTFSTKWSII